MKLTGVTHEPLDLTTSRSTDSTMTADEDAFQSLVARLPSPADDNASDVDSKPLPPRPPVKVAEAAAAAVPCRRSSRQRRRTAKAAEDDAVPLDEVAPSRSPAAPRRHHHHHRGGGGGRPAYICELCDKEFTKHSSLVRHTYQHSGEQTDLHARTHLMTMHRALRAPLRASNNILRSGFSTAN